MLLVPLLAFDRQGYRLGQGGGYYDRTLPRLRARGRIEAVGIGYSCQEVETVPNGPTDARLDWVVTEENAFRTAYPRGFFILVISSAGGPRPRVPQNPPPAPGPRVDSSSSTVENAAHGFGITEKICQALFAAGADAIVNRQSRVGSARDHPLHRKRAAAFAPHKLSAGTPAGAVNDTNWPTAARGGGAGPVSPVHECNRRPFPRPRCGRGRNASSASRSRRFSVDFHAEGTSEKMALGHFPMAGFRRWSAAIPTSRRRTRKSCRAAPAI